MESSRSCARDKECTHKDLQLLSNARIPSTKPVPLSASASAEPSVADNEQTFNTNDWVLVKYDKNTYPRLVTATVGSDVEVSVMEMAGCTGRHWKWPVKEDKILYTRDNVLCHTEPPELVGSRGQYIFKRFPNLKKK
jgi:hypothetical protein